MCDLNVIMGNFCSCLHPTQDPCNICNKLLYNPERQAQVCGGCDRNQNELCSNCPNKIDLSLFEVTVSRRIAEASDGTIGFHQHESLAIPPVPLEESPSKFACRILRLERNSRDVIDVIEVIPETEKFLRRFWEKKYGTSQEKECRVFISHHPFIQYLVMLMKIRVIPREASFYQLANVVEGIARA